MGVLVTSDGLAASRCVPVGRSLPPLGLSLPAGEAGGEERRRPRPPPQPWPLGPAPHSPARAWAWRPLVFQQSCRPRGVALWLLKVWRKVCFRSGPSAVLSNTTFLPHGSPVPLGFWEAWGPPVRAGLRQDEMCGRVRGRGGGFPRPLLKRPEESLLVTYL